MFLKAIAAVVIGVTLTAPLSAGDPPPAGEPAKPPAASEATKAPAGVAPKAPAAEAGAPVQSSGTPSPSVRLPTLPPVQTPGHGAGKPLAAADAASLEQVAVWVEALGAPEFEVREDATERLSKVGLVAIEPLVKAAQGPELEVSSRAIQVLRVMYSDAGDDVFDAVDSALFQLTTSARGPAARRSELALTTRESDREERLGARIRAMGGETAPSQRQIAMNLVTSRSSVGRILIGEDWKGGEAGLETLKRLGNLETIYVTRGANLSPEMLANLRVALPDVEIQMRGAAMLGISCPVGELFIESIQPNSAAQKADLRQGDKITKYDDKPIESFDELIDLTRNKKVGDVVKLEIVRDGMTIVKETQLGKWTLKEAQP